MWPARPRLRALMLNLALMLLVAACSRPAPNAADEAVPAAEVFDLAALPERASRPAWERAYPTRVSAGVSSDGGAVAIAGLQDPDGPPFVELLSAEDGKPRWSVTLPDGEYGGATVLAMGRGPLRVIAALAHADDGDRVDVIALDARGEVAWRREARAPVSAAPALDGSRVALIEHSAGRLLVLDAASGEAQRTFEVAPGATAAFVTNGALVVNDRTRVLIVPARGRAKSFDVDANLRRAIAIYPERDYVAVATSGTDNALYLFDGRGTPLWHAPLLPGGRNVPRFGPGGDVVYVFDVGDRAGIYSFPISGNRPAWRLFTRQAGGAALSVGQLAADSRGLTADFEAADSRRHTLVRLNAAGSPRERLELGQVDRVLLPDHAGHLSFALEVGDDGSRLRGYRWDESRR